MPTEDPWFDETEIQKKVRRQAAGRFLIGTKTDADLRRKISGFGNHVAARTEFERLGQITLPPDVHVVCLSGDRRELAKLVVFTLLDSNKPTPTEPYRKHWLAAWPPYK